MNLRILKKWVRAVVAFTTWLPWTGYCVFLMDAWSIFWPETLLQIEPVPPPSTCRWRRDVAEVRWHTSTLQPTARGLLLGP